LPPGAAVSRPDPRYPHIKRSVAFLSARQVADRPA